MDKKELLSTMPETYNTETLAARWHMEPETIEQWRLRSKGPMPRKVGKGVNARVIYYREDVLDYEIDNPNFKSEE